MTTRAFLVAVLFGAGLIVAVALALLIPRLTASPDRATLALKLLEEDRPRDAAFLFEAPEWRGVAEHRAGRHLRAVALFLSNQTPETIYNAGVAYARLHEWGAASAAFRKTLRLAPGHADALHNLAVVERAEAAERRLREEALGTRDRAGWEEGGLKTETGTGTGGERKEDGDAQGGETSAAKAPGDEGGSSATPGLAGQTRRADDPGGGPAPGLADVDLAAVEGMAGPAALRRRESAQSAEILLRRIRDDPARVLAARLGATHRNRMEREGAR